MHLRPGDNCFRCGDKDIPKEFHREHAQKIKEEREQNLFDPKEGWKNAKTEAFTSRGLTTDTVKRFGARLFRDATGKPSHMLFPFANEKGDVVAYKRKGILERDYGFHGKDKDNTVLFGQHLFPAGGKYITITEGEVDAMSYWQIAKSSRVPDPAVVSLANGANSVKKSFENKNVYEYVNSFENIILCLDNDKPGREATEVLISMLDPKKIRVVKLDRNFKDANEYLLAGKSDEFMKAWWNAETYKPNSILTFDEAWQQAKERKLSTSYPYPWKGWNDKSYGVRMGEMVVVTADTGVGKTQIFRELTKHFYDTTPFSMGGIFLEEVPAASVEGLVSMYVNAPIHLPDAEYDRLAAEKIAQDLGKSKRLYYYDDFGSNEIENVLNKVQFFVKVLGCKMIFLDHISMIVSDQRHSDERKALDEIATRLKQSTIEWDYNLHMIAHLNREGEIRGTANIEKLANIIINIERDKEAEDPRIRNTTRCLFKKNRFSGRTGFANDLYYDAVTGRMEEVFEEVGEETE